MKYKLTDKYITVEIQSPSSYWVTVIPYDTATISIPTLPAWITATDDGTNKILTLEFEPTVASETSYDFGDFTVYVSVVSTTTMFPSIEACCTDSLNIGWFNRLGGWQNWNFACKRMYQIEGENSKTFVNDITLKYSDINDVFQAVEVMADVFNRKQLDYISTLSYSIQAYLFNSATSEFDIPILIDRKSVTKYDKYGLGEKQFPFPFQFRFIYAKKLLIQTQ